jgi:hypothetical protein
VNKPKAPSGAPAVIDLDDEEEEIDDVEESPQKV